MELGIASWSVPWSIGVNGYPAPSRPLSAIGLVEKAVELNVRVVQIADNLPLDEMSKAEVDQLRHAAAAHGVILEAGTRSLDPAHLERYIEISHHIGARILRTVLSGSLLGPERLAAAEASLRQILPALERNGVVLAFENNEAFSAAEFAGLIRRLASPQVGICMDTANSLGRPETLETVVTHLAEHAVVLHAKDYDIHRIDTRMGFAITGTPTGGGRVNYDYVLSELRRHGRTAISVIVEHWPPFTGDIEETVRLEDAWLRQSVEFLRSKLVPSATA